MIIVGIIKQLWNPRAWKKKNSGFSAIYTYNLYYTGKVLYQLSYQRDQANWEMVTLWVRNHILINTMMITDVFISFFRSSLW